MTAPTKPVHRKGGSHLLTCAFSTDKRGTKTKQGTITCRMEHEGTHR